MSELLSPEGLCLKSIPLLKRRGKVTLLLASVNYLSLSLRQMFQIFIILLKPPLTTHFPYLIFSPLSRNLGQANMKMSEFPTLCPYLIPSFQRLGRLSGYPRSNKPPGTYFHSLQKLTPIIKAFLIYCKPLSLYCIVVTDVPSVLSTLILICIPRFHFFSCHYLLKSLLSLSFLASQSTL